MYGRHHLVEAYLGARERVGGYRADPPTFDAALRAYHAGLLDGLERLFERRLSPQPADTVGDRALLRLFSSTATSLLALRTPWSGFLEAGLLVATVERAGAAGRRVMTASGRIESLTAESRQAHREILDALATALLAERAELTFSAARLRALGVDDIAPDPADHPLDDD